MRFAKTLLALTLAVSSSQTVAQSYRDRLPEDETIYFVLPDRFENGDVKNDTGGLKGDRMKTGFDPSAKGFYHGGDLKGLTQRLDYIQGMGITAIWFAPVFKNKPVQGGPGNESAGYHGYWITDFTQVDPHFGTNAEFKTFVDAAHARGMKVYMDIIANHTADVIYFTECKGKAECPYRSKADYPYWTKGGLKGAAINAGFLGEDDHSEANFAKLTRSDYAYTPNVPLTEKNVKVPAWLNDPIYYHNRGNSTFRGESSRHGDFVGLDDLMTENPRVVQGFVDIYGKWIDDFGVDGFRIDTAKHVNPEFWQKFTPAILAKAKAKGIPNFHIFGEVFEDDMQPGKLARHTIRDGLPAVLDFAFAAGAVRSIGGNAPMDIWRDLIDQDVLYKNGADTARQLPTFLGNHDAGRFAKFVRDANSKADDAEILARVKLGHVMMMTARGVPTIYYGDEQGFAGDGGDQDAREDMFPSKVAVYNDNKLVGSVATTAASNFDTSQPIYRLISQLTKLRADNPALRRGGMRIRYAAEGSGLLAFTRTINGHDAILVSINTSAAPQSANVEVDSGVQSFTKLAGDCSPAVSAPGSAAVSLPAFGYAICKINKNN